MERARKNTDRGTKNKERKKIISIFCEGDKIEKKYFNELKKELKNKTIIIDVIPSKNDSSPKKIWDKIQEQFKSQELSKEYGDEAWLVFDVENKTPDPERTNQAKDIFEKCNNQTCFSAISNPCFEVWYLLHFEPINENLVQSQIKNKIKKYKKNYCKEDGLNFNQDLCKKTEKAINNSRKRYKEANKDENKFPENTSTQVHRLVERMKVRS